MLKYFAWLFGGLSGMILFAFFMGEVWKIPVPENDFTVVAINLSVFFLSGCFAAQAVD